MLFLLLPGLPYTSSGIKTRPIIFVWFQIKRLGRRKREGGGRERERERERERKGKRRESESEGDQRRVVFDKNELPRRRQGLFRTEHDGPHCGSGTHVVVVVVVER